MKSTLPKILPSYLKLLGTGRSSSGFTIIETLLAAIATALLIGAAGITLMKTMAEKQNTSVATNARLETDQTLAFIGSETEQAEAIPDAQAALQSWNTTFNGNNGTFLSGKQAVLALKVPGVAHPIMYFVTNSSSPWKGPRVIMRLGPAMNANGTYSNANNPSAWTSQAVIDGVANNTAIPNNCPNEVDADSDGTLDPGEDTNGNGVFDTVTPNSANAGFYACVRHDGTNRGEVAQLFLSRQLDQAYGQTAIYRASTTVMAHMNGIPSPGGPIPPLTSYAPNTGCQSKPINLGAAGDYGAFVLRTSFDLSSPTIVINRDLTLAPGVGLSMSQASTGTISSIRSSNGSQITQVQSQFGATPQPTAAATLQTRASAIYQAYAKATNMTPTQTFGSITANNTISKTTVVNVIDIEDINLNNQTLTINGATGDWFILNVNKDVKLSNGAQIAANGIGPSNILITVGGRVEISGGSIVYGAIVAPYSTAQIIDSKVRGALFAGQVNMSGNGPEIEQHTFGSGVTPLTCP